MTTGASNTARSIWAEPGSARREPALCSKSEGVKEGAHGGTLGSPVHFAR
jgi:hypothetical protein